MKERVAIATRGSALAKTQTEWVAERIRTIAPGVRVDVIAIKTSGDKDQASPLAAIGGKGLFTVELEAALLDGSADLAVHSLKDLPTDLPDGLALGAVPEREDPRDAWVCAKWSLVEYAQRGARVGTSSLRRAAQLRALRPDFEIVDLRGNVDTRVRKVRDGEIDAAVLACAGLKRLGREADIAQAFTPEMMLPAVGQGALAIECRAADPNLAELLVLLNDAPTWAEVTAERALLGEMGGGCQVPLGALGRAQGDALELSAVVCSADGTTLLRAHETGDLRDPVALGRRVAQALFAQGAAALIASVS